MTIRETIAQGGRGTRIVEIGIKEAQAVEHCILLEEVTHRLNNELASAIGYINMTATRSASVEVKETLAGIAAHFHEVANVLRALQMPAGDHMMDASEFLSNLCRSISRAKLQYRDIELTFRSTMLELDAKRCWKLGMMVSELITNAARHAFSEGGGRIGVDLGCRNGIVECTVVDNGTALPTARPGTGSKIVRALADDLQGCVESEFGRFGTIVKLQIPLSRRSSEPSQ